MTSNNGLSLTNTRNVTANNIYLNYDNDIINILDLFFLKMILLILQGYLLQL